MALIVRQLFAPQVAPTGTPGVIFTVPADASTFVLKNGRIRLTNIDPNPSIVSMYAAASAAPSNGTTMFFPNVTIGGLSFVDVDLPTMAAGDTLRVICNRANTVTLHEMGGVLHYT